MHTILSIIFCTLYLRHLRHEIKKKKNIYFVYFYLKLTHPHIPPTMYVFEPCLLSHPIYVQQFTKNNPLPLKNVPR